MTRAFILLVGVFLLLSPVHADASIGRVLGDTITNVKDRVRQGLEAGKEERLELHREIQVKRTARLTEHCRIVNARLTNFIEKLEARIAQLTERQQNTDAVKTAIADARTALANATERCEEAAALYNTLPDGEPGNNSDIRVNARELARQAHDEFSKARAALVRALQALSSIRELL